MAALKVNDHLYYVGVQDKDLRIFDIVMYTQYGTSYNAYVVKGDEKIAQSDGFLLGSPTLLGDALPPVWEMLLGVNPVIHKGKLASAFGSYAWSGEAVPNLIGRMKQLKLSVPLEGLRVKLKPSPAQLDEAREFGRAFAAAVLEAK